MGNCRLAKTHDLGYALDIGEAIGDISKVGIVQLILFLVIVFVIAFVLYFIGGVLSNWISTVGGIFTGIIGVFFPDMKIFAVGESIIHSEYMTWCYHNSDEEVPYAPSMVLKPHLFGKEVILNDF